MGVLVTLLISSKSRLHTFAVSQLSEQELHDATLLAGAAFSSIATVIELLIVISMTNVKLLPYLGPGIAAMGVVAAGYGLAFALAAAPLPFGSARVTLQ